MGRKNHNRTKKHTKTHHDKYSYHKKEKREHDNSTNINVVGKPKKKKSHNQHASAQQMYDVSVTVFGGVAWRMVDLDNLSN